MDVDVGTKSGGGTGKLSLVVKARPREQKKDVTTANVGTNKVISKGVVPEEGARRGVPGVATAMSWGHSRRRTKLGAETQTGTQKREWKTKPAITIGGIWRGKKKTPKGSLIRHGTPKVKRSGWTRSGGPLTVDSLLRNPLARLPRGRTRRRRGELAVPLDLKNREVTARPHGKGNSK